MYVVGVELVYLEGESLAATRNLDDSGAILVGHSRAVLERFFFLSVEPEHGNRCSSVSYFTAVCLLR